MNGSTNEPNPLEFPEYPYRPKRFVKGRRYRVRTDFKTYREEFREGEVLTYLGETYSHYDGCGTYFFDGPDTEARRVYDQEDSDPPEIWRERFEELPGEE